MAETRRVVLVCGPPGAGKTTLAKSLGLTVYDLDDPQWGNSEAVFRRALQQLAGNRNAQAVVIRAGATRSARAKAMATIGATEVTVIDTAADECIRRVVARNRQRPPLRAQIAAVKTWWSRYEPGQVAPQQPRRRVIASTTARGYGTHHQALRADYKRRMTRGERFTCWRCGMPVDPAMPWDLGHDDHDRNVYHGPEHRGSECKAGGNRATAGRRSNTVRRWTL